MAIVLRSSKNTPLTFTELDGNFTDLNTRTTALEANYIKTINGNTATSNAVTIDTDDVGEGSTNQYFTNTRARSAISVTDSGGDGSLSYNSSSGVITYTGPSASEVRAHISATSATGVTYSSGTGVIALTAIPNSSLTNSNITIAASSGLPVSAALGSTLNFTAGSGIDTTVSSGTVTIAVETDGIDDTHIDWGTGAGQVSTDDMPEGATNLWYTTARADARIAAASIDALSDVDTTSATPNNNEVLTWDGANWVPAVAPGASGGEANTISNVGTGAGVYKTKVGVDLRLRSLIGEGAITVTENTDDVTISLTDNPQIENLQITTNTISSTNTNGNIILDPNGTGTVQLSANTSVTGTLTATTLAGTISTASQPNITSLGTLTALALAGNIETSADIVFEGATDNAFETTLTVTDPTADRTVTLPDVSGTVITSGNLSDITSVGTLSGSVTFAGGFSVSAAQTVDFNANRIQDVADPTSAQDVATKAYVDAQLTAQDLDITADSGGPSAVDLDSQTLTVSGTANEIATSVSGQTITVGLANNVEVQGTLTVAGNLTVNGTTTTVNATELAIEDNLIYLNEGSTITNPDLGITGNYNDGSYAHAGIFRDASDGVWKFFDSYTPEPESEINVGHGSFALAPLSCGTFTSTGIDDNATSTAITINSSGNVIFTGNLYLGDNDKANFGASLDLQIYHDATNSYIVDNGTGSLKIAGSQIDLLGGTDGAETMATFVDNGAVTLYYNNAAKIATASDGISLTGPTNPAITASDGILKLKSSGSNDLYLGNASEQEATFVVKPAASGVNFGTISGAATGANQVVVFGVDGSDTNVSLGLSTKGTGNVFIGSGASVGANPSRKLQVNPDSASKIAIGIQASGTTATEKALIDFIASNGTGLTVMGQGASTAEEFRFDTVTGYEFATGSATHASGTVRMSINNTGTVTATTFDGEATSAQYADLAEMYVPDAEYPVGTVLTVGGGAEVTYCRVDGIPAGVVSSNPAYLMNSKLENGVAVALVGRVPVRVVGSVVKGQIVRADHNGVASVTAEGERVGIALESNDAAGEKLVECMLKV